MTAQVEMGSGVAVLVAKALAMVVAATQLVALLEVLMKATAAVATAAAEEAMAVARTPEGALAAVARQCTPRSL